MSETSGKGLTHITQEALKPESSIYYDAPNTFLLVVPLSVGPRAD